MCLHTSTLLSPSPVHTCCGTPKADDTFNGHLKQKRLLESSVCEIFLTKLEHWLIPACLAVPKDTELTTVNTWQEVKSWDLENHLILGQFHIRNNTP